MTMVRMKDLRRAGICSYARYWFAQNGLDWRDFVRNGIGAEKLIATGSAQDAVTRVIKAAKERESREESANG